MTLNKGSLATPTLLRIDPQSGRIDAAAIPRQSATRRLLTSSRRRGDHGLEPESESDARNPGRRTDRNGANVAVAGQPTPREVEFFESRVRPVLAESCIGCHGPKTQKAVSTRQLVALHEVFRGRLLGPGLTPSARLLSPTAWG